MFFHRHLDDMDQLEKYEEKFITSKSFKTAVKNEKKNTQSVSEECPACVVHVFVSEE